jgi:dolichol-phosphate mannosyltransferase
MLSVIIPAYNEEGTVSQAAQTVAQTLRAAEIPYQLLFVDDGSKDRTWEEICRAAAEDSNVTGIHFSRNFGKESAMFAGLERAEGDCCVVMDCDLQHPPEKLVEMYRLWQQGYEVVEGVKEDRGRESGAHTLAADSFYRLISRATGMDMSNASDFKLLDRKVVDTLNQLPERNVFFRALSYWVGYRKTEVRYAVQERTAGQSKWTTGRLVAYALNNLASFSSAPMQVVSWIGIIFLILSVVLGAQTLLKKFLGHALEGFTTVILIQLISCGLILLSLGIIGFYVARIYEEIKGRPRYIVSETCGKLKNPVPPTKH